MQSLAVIFEISLNINNNTVSLVAMLKKTFLLILIFILYQKRCLINGKILIYQKKLLDQIVAENPVDLDHLPIVAWGGVGVEHAGWWLVGAISPHRRLIRAT